MSVTLEEANRVINSAIQKATELDIKLSIAVVDAGGRLIAFARMDGAIWGGVYGSHGKANHVCRVRAAQWGVHGDGRPTHLPWHPGG